MFRLRATGIPADPIFPASLDKLGYFINDQDEIRSNTSPSDYYRYRANQNERYNEVCRESFHDCIRDEIFRRLENLGMKPLYLPQVSAIKPCGEPHVTILTTPPSELCHKRFLVLINNACEQDLAIWSYRVVTKEGGINAGSAVSLVKELIARSTEQERTDDTVPGIIILNPGQRLFSYRQDKALTHTSWSAQSRASPMHEAACVHPLHNYIHGNQTPQNHIEFFFKNVIDNPAYVRRDVNILLIGIRDGGNDLAVFLNKNWPAYSSRILAMAITDPTELNLDGDRLSGFAHFFAEKTRGWALSQYPLNTPLTAVVRIGQCPVLSGGEADHYEKIMPKSFRAILDWFEDVGAAFSKGDVYRNEKLVISKAVREEYEKTLEQQEGSNWTKAGVQQAD